MASLKSKQLQSPYQLRVVQVVESRPGPLLSEASSQAEFERAWVFLAPAIERSGEHTKASVLAALGRGHRQLWVSATSATITEMIVYPSGLKVMNIWLGGGDLGQILSWFPAMEKWGRTNGATQSRINGRRGWVKTTGYKEIRVVMSKDLTNV